MDASLILEIAEWLWAPIGATVGWIMFKQNQFDERLRETLSKNDVKELIRLTVKPITDQQKKTVETQEKLLLAIHELDVKLARRPKGA